MSNPVAIWRKSSFSTGGNANCVELGALGSRIAVRDSKNPTGPALTFPAASFFAFTSALRDGRL
jgi:hypothetical protein